MPPLEGIYAITPDVGPVWSERAVLSQTEALLAGGVKWVQCRQKLLPPPDRWALALKLDALCQAHHAHLVLNDAHPDCSWMELHALAAVHVGREDSSVAKLRAALPQHVGVGASCYNELERAVHAHQQGASYVAFGAVYASSTKPLAVQAPLSLFAQAAPLGLPTVAIGGIQLHHLPTLQQAGAQAVAVVTALYGEQPGGLAEQERLARQWVDAWKSFKNHGEQL